MSDTAHQHTPTDSTVATPESSPEPKKKSSYKIPRMIFWGLIVVVFLAVAGFVVLTIQAIPALNQIENPQSDLSTQLISADGAVLQNYYSDKNRVNVQLHEVSPHVIDALIATEDIRFYQHPGFDPKNAVSLLYRNIIKGIRSGGSTITMQLARNLFNAIGMKQTATRKIKEIIVSFILERKFTKEEILTAYLNTVNIYSNAYGIEMASQRLFGKSSRDLDLHESALIVGMLKGQGDYNPYKKPEKTKERRNLVFKQMIKYGLLDSTTTNIDSLKALELGVEQTQTQSHLAGLAPYFREHVRQYLKAWGKKRGYDLYTDGLKVYTTLDSRMQYHAEEAVKEHLTSLQKEFDKHIKGREPYKRNPSILEPLKTGSNRYKNAIKAGKSKAEIKKEFDTKVKMNLFTWQGERDTLLSPMDSIKHYARFLEVGFVSIDPVSGYVKAWVGGINYRHFMYDHVAKGERQVGSTFKPFVYTAAIDHAGYQPCDLLLNQPVFFEDKDTKVVWAPKNADGKVGGKMTLRHGLATSTNMITARLMKELGPNRVAKTAYEMGIKTKLEEVPSLCLGTTDLNVLEITGAYGTFANEGTWVEPIFITRIEDRNGNVLEEFVPKTRRALSKEKAYLMVELLKGVVDEPGGTAGRLRYKYGFNNEIAGKTGTTQNHSDGWFIGVTPNLVSGVWVGAASRQMRFRSIKLGQGAHMALPVWALYMKRVYEDPAIGIPKERFEKPEGMKLELTCVREEGEENPLDDKLNQNSKPTDDWYQYEN
ncbi:MAG: transglycosylase domain-containing protein [Bacteroidota bacterium]